MAAFIHLIDQRRLIGPGGSTVSGRIYFYYSGTSVKAPVFQDIGLSVPAPNPVDVGAGEVVPLLFLDTNIVYRRVIQYSDGTYDEQDPLGELFSEGELGVPVGTVTDFAGSVPPDGFLFCFGQAVSRTEYSSLFSVIGTTYGAGNGTTTFNLPDYRGVVLAGKDNMGGVAAGRLTAPIIDGIVLGATGGVEEHALTDGELPWHSHDATVNDPGHSHFYTGAMVPGAGYQSGSNMQQQTAVVTSHTTTDITVDISATGGGFAHTNVQPTTITNKIIKVLENSFLSLIDLIPGFDQKANAVVLGVTGTDTNMGEFVSPSIPNNASVKEILNEVGSDLDNFALNIEATKIFVPPAQSGSLTRPFIRRARDTASALDLLSSNGLDDAIRHREATSADAAEITAAVQNVLSDCASKGWQLNFPAGDYWLNSQLVASTPVHIVGDGIENTSLKWANSAASAGIKISAGGVVRSSRVDHLSLLTGRVAQGTAIEMDYSSLISGSVIVPRAENHGSVRNVRTRGLDGYTVNGWDRGLVGISMLGLFVDGCRFNGIYTGAYGSMPQSAAGISFGGSGSPVALMVNQTMISAFQDAVLTQDAEGIYLNNCEFVTVGRAYKCVNAAPESGLFINAVHMAVIEAGIDLSNMADGRIRDVLLYNVADATPITGVILRDGVKNMVVEGNEFRRLGGVTTMLGIDVKGGQDNVIGMNSYDVGGTGKAINIDAAALRTKVLNQDYIVAPSAAPITNASTTSQFVYFRGYAGDLNAIYTDWKIQNQTHILAAGATNTPAAWGASVAGGVIETTSLDVNTAIQRAINPNVSGIYYTRRKAAGTWTAWS